MVEAQYQMTFPCPSTHPKLTCASAAWLRRAPPVPTGVAMVLLLFEPFLEPPPLPPTTKVLEPFEELDTVRVISVMLRLVTFDRILAIVF